MKKSIGIRPLEIDGVRHNSNCGVFHTPAFRVQRSPCTCGAIRHGAAVACATAARRPPYEEAVKHRPRGACYCDLDDRACYAAGHWHPTNAP
jgi:hypothetical protein